MAEIFHQFAQRENRVGLQLLGADVVGDLVRASAPSKPVLSTCWSRTLPALSDAAMNCLHVSRRYGMVQRVGGRHRADEDQHDQAHALLPII